MAKVTYKSDLFKGDKLKRPIDETTARNIGDTVIKQMNNFIARGQSPVRDQGRFVGYKHQQISGGKAKPSSENKRGYPYSVMHRFPDKKVRPVNLRLTGQMLAALAHKFYAGAQKIELGIFSGKEALKAETHNEGTQEPRVPRRHFLPTEDGESFAETIQRDIIAIVKRRISYIIQAIK